MADSSPLYEYKVGGSLPPNALTYVRRQADEDLFTSLKAGTFCYVLNSRQMGKSSLRVRTMHQLQRAGVVCVTMDLTEIVEQDMSKNQFYKSITRHLGKGFNLLSHLGGFNSWWHDYEETPKQGFANFIKEVLLKYPPLATEKLAIFIDEIDSVLRLKFSVNDFFAIIRACYNNRAEIPDYNRLTFAILGVASPYDLIKDSNHSPPFNFGQAIELKGFQLHEAEPLAEGLKVKSKKYKRLLKAALSWTGGQPFLTQKLCKLMIDADDRPSQGQEEAWVEQLVRSRIIENWEGQDEPEHLKTIRDRLARHPSSQQLLQLYSKIWQPPNSSTLAIASDDSPEQMKLRLSGITVKQNGILKVSNRIYESVFDGYWVEKTLKTLTDLQPLSATADPEDEEIIKSFGDLERKLFVALAEQVNGGEGSDQKLYEVLRDVMLQLGNLLQADRASIFLLNEEKTELWSIVAENEGGEFLDIQVRVGEGIAGQVVATKQIINIPERVYQDARSQFVRQSDLKYNYHTYNILAVPILNVQEEPIAVVQLLNKLKASESETAELSERIDRQGFTEADEKRLLKSAPWICRILESCQYCYKATRKLRATAALSEATRSLDKANLDTKEILQRVMNAAKKLMNADRSTLWLVDRDRGDLWTEIAGKGKLRCDFGVGFAGQVAQTREPMIIPFDLYEDPRAGNAKETDKKTGYRTCSLLCMPVLNPDGDLLGVTQLLNKRKPGNFPESASYGPEAPEQFKVSFDENDRQSMQVFNERVGVILQHAKTYEALQKIVEINPKDVVHNALSMLSSVVDNQDEEVLYSTLNNILKFVAQSLGKLLNAERMFLFIFNVEQQEFWSLIDRSQRESPTEVWVPSHHPLIQELMGQQSGKRTNYLQGSARKCPDLLSKMGGGLHHLLSFPIFQGQESIIAIVQAVNKLATSPVTSSTPSKAIDPQGFTQADEEKLQQRIATILPILEGCQSFYSRIRTLQENRETHKLLSAIASVRESSNPQETLQKVMEAAKRLTNSDRSTLWLVDPRKGDLRAEILGQGELRCEMGVGFAGKVAQTRESIRVDFDLYDHPDAAKAKKTDEETGYRTFSLLCMPVLSSDGELLGVTQLLNKRKPGNFPEYKPSDKRRIPDHFKVGFNERDRRYMEIFNNQVGIILQRDRQRDLIRTEIQNRLSSSSF